MFLFNEYLLQKIEDPEIKKIYLDKEPEFQISWTIAGYRANSGISQNGLSEKTGISVATIRALETGDGNPSLDTLKKLASGMNMKLVIRFDDISTKD